MERLNTMHTPHDSTPARRPRLRLLIVALLALFALVTAACGGDDDDSVAAGDDPFGSTEWVLVDGTVDGEPLALLDSHPVTLQVDGDDVGGVAACNGYFGAFTGDDVLFGDFGVTEMACDPPAAMSLEAAFLSALGRVDTAALDGASLVLTGDDVSLRFDAVPPTPDADLEGTTWMLDTIIDGDAASSLLAGTSATLTFDNDRVSGTDGCNTLDGSFEVDGDTIRVGDLAMTTRGCEQSIAIQAESIGRVLASSPSFTIDGNRLTLTGPDDLGLSYTAT